MRNDPTPSKEENSSEDDLVATESLNLQKKPTSHQYEFHQGIHAPILHQHHQLVEFKTSNPSHLSPLVKTSRVTQNDDVVVVEFCTAANATVLQLKQPRRSEDSRQDKFANLRELLGENFETIIMENLSSAAF